MARRRKILSEEDKHLWKRVTSTIESSHEHVGLAIGGKKPEELFKRFAQLMSAPKKSQTEQSTPVPPPPQIPPRIELRPRKNHAFDHKTRKNIVKGRIAIDAKIDLHGLTQNSAIARLRDFLYRAQSNDCRLVLVITGKGDRGNGVLRRQVPNWLSTADLQNIVSSYQEAHISHGGSGALYVRLRRL